jgi:hypothetical protein
MEQAEKELVKKMIDEASKKMAHFSTRKLGDTPTDELQLTPKKYVTMNGSVAGRPTTSVASVGQFYLATDTNVPMWYTTNKNWINGVGSVVA